MYPVFEIKYELFEDQIEELRTIDIVEFDKEWHQIYGPFTVIVDGHEFIAYPSPDMPLSAKMIYSELILTHFYLLIDACNSLNSYKYIALKYVENCWTWLEIQVDDEVLILSEKNDEIPYKYLIQTNKSLLENAPYGSFANIRIHKSDFVNEIRAKIVEFIKEIQAINSELLKSVYFSKLLRFCDNQSKGDTTCCHHLRF
ncbi:hypothetical protein [Paenibacillus borealis]|uniref:Uncharacterized protein n=1 Tax=Paenibacillus borealis TaxID=160799 RepID=A0A089LCQ3_PAEBO|nr:hypothetical protein [Paenibacillus borealis]AIQ59281.1 hypothetical protein PBOR_21785 [Paenibacillus borealis]